MRDGVPFKRQVFRKESRGAAVTELAEPLLDGALAHAIPEHEAVIGLFRHRKALRGVI